MVLCTQRHEHPHQTSRPAAPAAQGRLFPAVQQPLPPSPYLKWTMWLGYAWWRGRQRGWNGGGVAQQGRPPAPVLVLTRCWHGAHPHRCRLQACLPCLPSLLCATPCLPPPSSARPAAQQAPPSIKSPQRERSTNLPHLRVVVDCVYALQEFYLRALPESRCRLRICPTRVLPESRCRSRICPGPGWSCCACQGGCAACPARDEGGGSQSGGWGSGCLWSIVGLMQVDRGHEQLGGRGMQA